MLQRGDHKSEKSDVNMSALEKSIDKEVEQIWEMPLTIDSIHHIKIAGDVPLG